VIPAKIRLDFILTYIGTPDLKNDGNPLIMVFNHGIYTLRGEK
jgi:hypothetical protein